MALTLKTKVGDRSTWTMTLKEGGVARDLTAALTVKINTRVYGASALTTNAGACTVTSAAEGICTYSPATADVATAGIYEVEVTVTWTDGKVSKFPSDGFGRLEIDAALD